MGHSNLERPARVGLAILARAPVPGEAKTRLIPLLGAGGAARLQRWLLRRTVAVALAADIGPVSLWCAGAPEHPEIQACRGLGELRVERQPAGDLGLRMLTALRRSPTPAGTLIIGTDCPAMDVSHLRQAAQTLRERDAVAIPAEDGGYVLIGMKLPAADVFMDIDWGTDRVMRQTRDRFAAAGWGWDEPAVLWDVDRPEDVARFLSDCPGAGEALGVSGATL